MASIENIVRRLTVIGTTQGVDKVAADLNAVDAAQKRVAASGDAVAVVTDTSTKRQTSAASAYERMRTQVDSTYRSQQQYAKAQDVADRALRQGVITQNEHGKALELARSKYGVVTAGAKSYSYELLNLSRQAQDFGVQVASGGGIFMPLIQQGSQVYDVFSQMRARGDSVSEMLAKVFTPARLVAGGIAAIGAAAVVAMNSTANWVKGLDDLSRTAGTSANEMLKLQSAAAVKGIGQQDFAAGITQFANQVYYAKNGLGELGEFLRANGMAAKDFDTAFANVSRLIQRGRDDMEKLQLLQRAGLPATMEWVRLLQQGPEGLQKIKDQLQGVPEKFDELVAKARAFDEAWNKAWVNFAVGAKASIADVLSSIPAIGSAIVAAINSGATAGPRQGTSGAIRRGIAGAGGGFETEGLNIGIPLGNARKPLLTAAGLGGALTAGAGADAAKQGPVDQNILKGLIAQYQAYVGVLGEFATVGEQVKAKQNEITLANLNGAGVSKELARQITELTRIKAEERRQQEGVTNGIFDETKARALIEAQIALEKSRRDSLIGDSLEKEQAMRTALIEKMKEQRTAAIAAGSGLPQLTRMAADAADAKKQIDEFATKSLGNLENALVDIGTKTKSVSDAFKSMVDAIEKDLLRLIIRQSITAPLASGLTGLLKGLVPSAHGNVFGPSGIQPFAAGGVVNSPTLFKFANGTGLMGEAGPEAIMPLRRTPSGKLGVETTGGAAMPQINFVQYVSGADAEPPRVTRGSDGSIQIEQRIRALVRSELDSRNVRVPVGRR